MFNPESFLATALAPDNSVPSLETITEYGAEIDFCGPVVFLYRAYAACCDAGGPWPRVDFHFARYRAVRFTPHGVWITDDPSWYDKPRLRWVALNPDGKRLAYVKKEHAMRALQHRNARHVAILEHNLACARQVYAALNSSGT